MNEIDALIEKMPSRMIRSVQKGTGSFVTFDVGIEHSIETPDGTEKRQADLHLWVYLCDWELVRDGVPVLTSTSEHDDFAGPLETLVGERLTSIGVG